MQNGLTVDCLVICRVPAARIGLEAGLRDAGHSVRSTDYWHGHLTVEQVIITDLGENVGCSDYLSQLRSGAPGALIIVWADPVPGHAEITELYDRWIVPSQSIGALCRAISLAASRRPRYYLGSSRQTAEVEIAHRTAGLTKRELQIFRQFHPGVYLTEQELAFRLNLSVNTIRTHLRRIEAKTGVHSLRQVQRLSEADLVRLAQPPLSKSPEGPAPAFTWRSA